VVAAIRQCVRTTVGRIGHGFDVRAVAVVVPGMVDAAAGIARYSVNLGWRDVPLRELLQQDVRVPLVIDHDVRAAGLAESVLGRARGEPDALLVVIGTGVAAVVIAVGQVVRGATGSAGELGHLIVHPGGEPCVCGQRGCLETYGSAGALQRRFAAVGGNGTAAEIVAAAGTDPVAHRVWQEATDAIGRALAMATVVLDSGLIVLGGGLAEAGAALLEPVRASLAAELGWREAPDVELSSLASRAGRAGAAMLAWAAAGGADLDAWAESIGAAA
jgi:glucokinase